MITISRTEYEGLEREIAELRSIIKSLENTIALMKGGRDSRTGFISPSQDIARSNTFSLRTSNGKKPGGQVGY